MEAHQNLIVRRTIFGQGWILLKGTDERVYSELCSWRPEVAAIRTSSGRDSQPSSSSSRAEGRCLVLGVLKVMSNLVSKLW